MMVDRFCLGGFPFAIPKLHQIAHVDRINYTYDMNLCETIFKLIVCDNIFFHILVRPNRKKRGARAPSFRAGGTLFFKRAVET
jgi:hypothetical protein